METQFTGSLNILIDTEYIMKPDIDVSNLSVKEGRVGVVISQYEMEYFRCGDVIVGRPDASADSSPQFQLICPPL